MDRSIRRQHRLNSQPECNPRRGRRGPGHLADTATVHPTRSRAGGDPVGAAADRSALQPGSAHVFAAGRVATGRHAGPGVLGEAARARALFGCVCAVNERRVLYPLLHRAVRAGALGVPGVAGARSALDHPACLVGGQRGDSVVVSALAAQPAGFGAARRAAQSRRRHWLGRAGQPAVPAVDDLAVSVAG